MQTVLMQHVWWKSLNPVNTLFFVIEVWMKVPRQVHGDGAERWRNQSEQKVVTDSDCSGVWRGLMNEGAPPTFDPFTRDCSCHRLSSFSETPVWLHRFNRRTAQNLSFRTLTRRLEFTSHELFLSFKKRIPLQDQRAQRSGPQCPCIITGAIKQSCTGSRYSRGKKREYN